MLPQRRHFYSVLSLRSRPLKVVNARKNGCLRVSLSSAPVLSCTQMGRKGVISSHATLYSRTERKTATQIAARSIAPISWATPPPHPPLPSTCDQRSFIYLFYLALKFRKPEKNLAEIPENQKPPARPLSFRTSKSRNPDVNKASH